MVANIEGYKRGSCFHVNLKRIARKFLLLYVKRLRNICTVYVAETDIENTVYRRNSNHYHNDYTTQIILQTRRILKAIKEVRVFTQDLDELCANFSCDT